MSSSVSDSKTRKLLSALPDHVQDFLSNWAENMARAGYLEHTTAKVEDCVLSFRWFIEPLLEQSAKGKEPCFERLILDKDWAAQTLQTARRHRRRGVTAEMFFGCFKTLIHAVERIILDMDFSPETRLRAIRQTRTYADALETLIVEDWTSISDQESRKSMDQSNRLLTLEKNKYENILSSISDLVLILDSNGKILEANKAASELLKSLMKKYSFVWEVLGLEGESMDEVIIHYPLNQAHEISVCKEKLFFELKIIPLSMVSLASQGFILVLNNITSYVSQRVVLEQNVRERTEELREEKAQVEEMVITLKNVLATVEKSRKEQMSLIAENIEEDLLPTLGRIKNEKNSLVRQSYIELFQDQLIKLAGRAGSGKDPRLLKLTPAEMKICRFIQAGQSSKNIAEALNISVGTVNTHRKNIRKKIGLKGKDRNLFSFLQYPKDNPANN